VARRPRQGRCRLKRSASGQLPHSGPCVATRAPAGAATSLAHRASATKRGSTTADQLRIIAGWGRSTIGANLRVDGSGESAHLWLSLSGRIADVADNEAGSRQNNGGFCRTKDCADHSPDEHLVDAPQHIPSYAPEGRGRMERLFGILQSRLPPLLRLEGTASIEAANPWLAAMYVPQHNARFCGCSRRGRHSIRALRGCAR